MKSMEEGANKSRQPTAGPSGSRKGKKVQFQRAPLTTHLEDDESNDGLSRKEKLQELIKKKKACDAIAKEVVLALIETGVQKAYLLEKAWRIGPPHWEDVVEERQLSKICGWVLCDAELEAAPKQQYIIRGKKVLDITERKKFCSSHCYAASDHFKGQLLDSPLWMREEENIPQFEVMEDKSMRSEGIIIQFNNLELDDVETDEDKAKDSEEEEEES